MESCAQKKTYKAKDYKSELKPIWCPGCGDYTVLNSITRALAELALPPEESPSSPASAVPRASRLTPVSMASTACMAALCPSPPA
jgi:2-oxoglutarate ferredoxin oxidoreductase subunit beta